MVEYKFKKNGVIHVIQCKPSMNKKLGLYEMMIQTYHISEEQLQDYRNDSANCLDCQYSYNQNGGESGGCYTHKGYQGMGIKSMIKRLSKVDIGAYNKAAFDGFIGYISQFTITLCRLGAYGEPVLMPLNMIEKLVKASKKHTGYTHQWNKPEYLNYSKYLMASTHSKFETAVANSLGYRAFESNTELDRKMPICPASKKFTGEKKTCVQCVACCGTFNKKSNNIFIYKH